MLTMEYHRPVLLTESVDGLNIKPNGIYIDVTFGGGGHSREILKLQAHKKLPQVSWFYSGGWDIR